MKDVTLNQREQARLQVLNCVLEYQLPRTQAAEIMGISERQLRRILAAYRRDGAAALSHGNRDRQPRNTIPEEITDAVIILASEKYAGFNHSHLSEVLAEREDIHLSRQTLSRLLNRHGLPSARRHRPPKHRIRWERMPQEDMLLQIDGSHHAWLEERGPRFVLLLAVDDATGTVADAVFQPGEDTSTWALPSAEVALPGAPNATDAAGGRSNGPGSTGGADAVFACAAHGADSSQGGTSVFQGHLFNVPGAGLGLALQTVDFNGFGGRGHNRRLLLRWLPGL